MKKLSKLTASFFIENWESIKNGDKLYFWISVESMESGVEDSKWSKVATFTYTE